MKYLINFKTIFAFLFSVFLLSSCSSEKNVSSGSEQYEEKTQKNITEADDFSSSPDKPDNDKDSSGFDILGSGEYASAMKEEHFVLTYYIPEHQIIQTVCIDDGNVFSEFSDPGVSYKIIYLQSADKQYMIVDDCYCETSVSDTPENIIKIYSDLEYISSGTQDKDGETLNYDEFRQKRLGSSIRLLTDSEGVFKAFDQSGTVAEIKYFGTDADKSLFKIPDNCKKVSENEIRTAIEAKISSHNR